MDSKFIFEKLNNDNNFFTWKYRVEMLLKREAVNKAWTVPKPADTKTTALAAWLEKDEKATALIGSSVMDNLLQHIRNAQSAKKIWDALKAFHEQKLS